MLVCPNHLVESDDWDWQVQILERICFDSDRFYGFSSDIGIPGVENDSKIPPLPAHTCVNRIMETLHNADTRLVAAGNLYSSSTELMRAVHEKLRRESESTPRLVIPITFGDYSPIELDPGTSLSASIGARILFAVH